MKNEKFESVIGFRARPADAERYRQAAERDPRVAEVPAPNRFASWLRIVVSKAAAAVERGGAS